MRVEIRKKLRKEYFENLENNLRIWTFNRKEEVFVFLMLRSLPQGIRDGEEGLIILVSLPHFEAVSKTHRKKAVLKIRASMPALEKGGKMEKENLCACGARCVYTVRVKYPNGRVVEFCHIGCPAYRQEKKQADKAWKSFRAKKAQNEKNGDLARKMAEAAKAAKPKPGSPEAQKARMERESRRAQNRAERLAHRPVGRSN